MCARLCPEPLPAPSFCPFSYRSSFPEREQCSSAPLSWEPQSWEHLSLKPQPLESPEPLRALPWERQALLRPWELPLREQLPASSRALPSLQEPPQQVLLPSLQEQPSSLERSSAPPSSLQQERQPSFRPFQARQPSSQLSSLQPASSPSAPQPFQDVYRS